MHTAHCVRSEYLSALRKYTIRHTQLLRHTPRLHDYYITSLTVLEEFTNHTLPALKILAEGLSLIRQSYLYQKWSAADWFFGLLVYAHQHRTSREPAVRNAIKSSAARSTSPQVGSLVKYVRICDAIYAPTTEQFCAESGIPQSRVIRVHSGGVLFPKSILLLDHADKEVIVAIRGSASILDFCIDLCLLHEPFLDGYGHRGIAHASRWMLQHSESDILDLHERYPDYSVVFTGHSLGAGLAALASIALHRKSSDTLREKLLCIGFATPACITPQLARDCRPFVTSIIHGDDCIPRLHQHSLLRLQKLVSTFDWRTSLKQMIVEELEGQKNRAHDHFASTINEQTQLVRKTRERMQQIRQRRDGSFQHINYIITRLEDLKFDEKRAEASAKMTQVGKKIGEQVRDQFSGKWYAALEYFHMDQLDLHKVEELKKALLAKYDWVGALTSTEEKVKKLTEKVVVRGNDLKAHVPPQLGHWYSQLTRLYDIAIGQLGPRSTDSTQPEEKVHRLEAKMQLMAESDMEQNKNPSKKASEWSEEPLVSPGRVLYLVQKDGTEGTAVLEPVDNDSFNEVLLSDNMIRDHLCTTYEEVLRALHDQMEKVHSENR